ncbi:MULTISPECIES: hypothetical protein [Mycolicibacter]|uniref:Small CPxCG-related zinc finger protein n=2 Tax=Mycolicibacter TaxID=1073531 RepID=A0ABU5XLU9_9MYCO|nr:MULTISPECIES: hypothetical protein [unclassified Mycolicibacter]MEB3022938.1 hypothetical protein [Mycolicibacter sp. MYC098]MEB3035075.1 hypothetical protein [Mycolicibacter sp. MYC340]
MASQQYECGNCALILGDEEQMNEIRDLEQRIDPGGVVPAGECPECGALMYVVESG